jgi:hypothetical protein
VVGLGEQREAVALEPLGHPDLPQRLVAVERLREHAPGERAQLVLGPRRGQRGRADVVAEVQVRVVDPARAALVERDEREPLAVPRDEVEAAVDVVEQLVVARRPAGEGHHRGDVHVRGGVLEVQK